MSKISLNQLPKNKIFAIFLVIIAVLLCITVNVFSKNIFAVYEGESVTVFSSSNDIPANALTEKGVVISEDKYVEMPELVRSGVTKIHISQKKKVNLKISDNTTLLYSEKENTLKELFDINGIFLGEYDTVSLPLSSEITDGMEVEIVRINHISEEKYVDIPYSTEKKPSANMYKGDSRVLQSGKNGSKKQVYEIITTNGNETSRTLLSETVISEPKAKIIEYGTKERETHGTVKAWSGETLSYKKVINMTATAYTTERTSDKITATGQVARVGLVAVDPKVIPLGSKLYIVSQDGKSWCYGIAVAGDTGVKGNTIDLFFNTYKECISFGRRKATVYVLK